MYECFSGVEELDTVRLLLQPVQLGLTNYIVHDKYCSCASPTHWLQLVYCFHGRVCSLSSEQLYNSRARDFVLRLVNMSIQLYDIMTQFFMQL